jgi:nitrate reductase (NAD(P)H)
VTEKGRNFIKKNAEQAAKEKTKSQEGSGQVVLHKHRWVPVKLLERKSISEDTRTYTFALPDDKTVLGLGTCQHVQLGFHFKDKMVIQPYTPTAPVLPAPEPNTLNNGPQVNGHQVKENRDQDKIVDGNGTFELTVKTYFPTKINPAELCPTS